MEMRKIFNAIKKRDAAAARAAAEAHVLAARDAAHTPSVSHDIVSSTRAARRPRSA
jgi:hypothetical protein